MKNQTVNMLLITTVGLVILLGIGTTIANPMMNSSSRQTNPGMNDEIGGMMKGMGSMMGNDGSTNQMMKHMEEMMNDPETQNEMLEHMKDCPMMKNMMD